MIGGQSFAMHRENHVHGRTPSPYNHPFSPLHWLIVS